MNNAKIDIYKKALQEVFEKLLKLLLEKELKAMQRKKISAKEVTYLFMNDNNHFKLFFKILQASF